MSSPSAKLAATQKTPAYLLYHGIKNLLRCDESDVVSGIVSYVISKHAVLRFMAPRMEKWRSTVIPQFFALLAWLRAFLAVQLKVAEGRTVWIARLSNERTAIEWFVHNASELSWTQLKFRNWPDRQGLISVMKLSGKLAGARRIAGIARRLHRRHEFFKVLRVMELMAYSSRYLQLFNQHNFKLAVTSSHSNPHAIAFNLVARKCRVPIVLITHGMPVRPLAKLSFNLALVHCEAARQTYSSEGCKIDEVLIHGRKEQSLPMPNALPDSLSIGIFLCKDVNERTFLRLLNLFRKDKRISRIVIRPHPKNLWKELDNVLVSLNDSLIMKAAGESVWDDLRQVDVVIGGNSSVLIDSVVAGRPAIYVPLLDYAADDMHQLVSSGLVYRFEAQEFSFEDVLKFYHSPDWPKVLRSFAAVDDDRDGVARQFCERMREFTLAHHSSPINFSPTHRQQNYR